MTDDLEIPDLDEADLGPAMRRCTKREQKFVRAMIMTGGSQTRSAAIAGYASSSQAVLRQGGYQVAHRDTVQSALLEEAIKNGGGSAVLVAQSVIMEILTKPKANDKDRLTAARMVRDWAIPMRTEHKVEVTHDVGDNLSMLAMLRAKIAADPSYLQFVPEPIRLMLDAPADKPIDDATAKPVIDAEFTEVIDWGAENVIGSA